MRRAAVILALLTVLWAVDAAVGSGVFWVHDLRHHHTPWRVWAAGEWAAGRVPLWAPDVANGYPLMAEGQTGVFYAPTILLFMLLSPGAALNTSLLLHTLWAGLGGYWFQRRLGRSSEAALLGAVGFAFSGFLATHALYLGLQNAVAWLPWLLGAVVARRWPLVGLSAALMMVAGHPQAAALGMGLAGCFALWESARLRTWPLAFSLAMGLALVAASPQLIATLELVGFSMRDGGVGAAFAQIGSLPPQELINGVLPRFFGFDRPGDVLETYYHRGTHYWGAGVNHWEMAFYLGLPLAMLAVPGGVALWRQQRFWPVVAGCSVLLMLGGPLWTLVRMVPGLGGFRFPARFALLLVIALTVMAAVGLDHLRASPSRERWARATAIVGVTAYGLICALHGALRAGEQGLRAALSGFFQAQVDRPLPPLPDPGPLARAALPEPVPEDAAGIPDKVDHIVAALLDTTAPWGFDALWPLSVLVLLAIAITRLRQPGVPLAVVALLYVDLWQFGAGYQVRVPASAVSARSPLLAAVPDSDHRLTVVDRRQGPALDTTLQSASLGLMHGTADVILTSPLLIVRNEAVLATAGLDVGDKGAVKVERLAAHPGLVDLLGLRWLLSVHDLEAVGYPEVARSGPVGLFENLDPLPRAMPLGCARPTAEPWSELPDLDPRSHMLVESDAPADLPVCGEVAGGVVGSARRVPTGDPAHLRFELVLDRDAVVLQRDTWYPGWTAEVDGVQVPLFRADLIFRGVVAPMGAQRLDLRYEPGRLRAALMVAPMALILLGIWALFGWRRGKVECSEP